MQTLDQTVTRHLAPRCVVGGLFFGEQTRSFKNFALITGILIERGPGIFTAENLSKNRVQMLPFKHYNIMKKALRETQTLRAGCSKAEPKIFALPQTPFLGAQDGQNLISWRWSLPSPTNQVW